MVVALHVTRAEAVGRQRVVVQARHVGLLPQHPDVDGITTGVLDHEQIAPREAVAGLPAHFLLVESGNVVVRADDRSLQAVGTAVGRNVRSGVVAGGIEIGVGPITASNPLLHIEVGTDPVRIQSPTKSPRNEKTNQ